jgi:excisionase family DNA binding protein
MKSDPENTLSVMNPGDKLLTVLQAAELSAVNHTEIRRAVKKGELRFYGMSTKSRRLLLSELQAWWKTKVIIDKTGND